MGLLDRTSLFLTNTKPAGSRQIPPYSVREEYRSLEAALACLGAITPRSSNC